MAQREEIGTVFTIASWDEKPYVESEGVKLTKARFEKEYRGDIAGKSVTESLMTYRPDGSASFIGHERFEGTVRGKRGSFVMESSGQYRNDVAESKSVVIEGSGTGDLRGVKGEAPWRGGHEKEHPLVFHLSFD